MRAGIAVLVLCQAVLGQSGPALVGAGYVNPIPVRVAPGQVVTFFLTGFKTVLPGPFRAAVASTVSAEPVAGIAATIRQTGPGLALPVPVFRVDQLNTCSDTTSASPDCLLTAVKIQVPFELRPRDPLALAQADQIGVTDIIFYENGTASQAFVLSPVADNIKVMTNCGDARMDEYGSLPCQSMVAHANGDLVSVSNPAQAGEIVVIYATGLGATTPAVASGEPSPMGALAAAMRIDLDFRPNAGPSRLRSNLGFGPTPQYEPTWVGLTPSNIGIYQVNFQVPQPPVNTPPCGNGIDSNLTVTVQGSQSYDAAKLCVQP